MSKNKSSIQPKYIIDSHSHYGFWPTLKKCENNLITSINEHNISFSLISFDGTEFKENSNFSKIVSTIEGCKKLLNLIKKYPNTFGMLIWIRPFSEKNVAEIEYFIKNHKEKIYGLKFHPYLSHLRISDKKVTSFFDIATKFNLPILVHTANDKYSQLKYLIRVCKKYPSINFIAAHCVLETDHKEILIALKENPNLYCDTAWVDIHFIKILKENNLMDRVIFGTDNPIDGVNTLNEKIYENYFKNSINLSSNDINNLMYKNATRIYHVPLNVLKNN